MKETKDGRSPVRRATSDDPPREVPTVTWGELTPEEAEEFFGKVHIGRIRFPSHTAMRLPRDEADREYRARYLTEQLVAWYRRGSDRRNEHARIVLTTAAWAMVDPAAAYDAAREQLGSPPDLPAYEELMPPDA